MYSPHVVGIMAGQNLDIKNGDPTNHNIHPMPKVNADFNQSQPPGAANIEHAFPREEVLVPVKCNIHPWMRAYIGVVNHPFFAVTGDDGSYSINPNSVVGTGRNCSPPVFATDCRNGGCHPNGEPRGVVRGR